MIKKINCTYFIIFWKVSNLTGLFFDGKKSWNRTILEDEEFGTVKHINIKRENVVLVQEPGSKFVGYVTPSSSNAEDTCDAILNKLNKLNVDLSELLVVGGDGCNTNTRWKNGTIRKIEERLGRSLIWIICLLHLIELCFKKVYESLYGKGKGPTDFGSELGTMLETCHTLPVVKFKKINVKLPEINLEDLNSDQKYLFAMSLGIKTGKVDHRLAQMTPGPLYHARWMTCAARCLRYYASAKTPSKEFQILVSFIMKVKVEIKVFLFHSDTH